MAKIRVHELAKEYGMTGKEMLQHLADMKIPAKSASASLEDAYISIIRRNLAPIMEQRAAQIEAEKQAAEQAEKQAAEEAAREAEEQRLAAEARREEERRIEAARRAEEEKRRADEEAARKAEEEKRRAEEESKRPRDTAPKSAPSFSSLLAQIAQQERVLADANKQKEEAAAAEKAEQPKQQRSNGRNSGGENRGKQGGKPARGEANKQQAGEGSSTKARLKKDAQAAAQPEERAPRSAEEYSRDRILAEARAAVQEASRETGRRKKRKERRELAAEEARHQEAVADAIANDQNPADLDVVKIREGITVSEFADALEVSANDIIKRLFLLGSPLTLTQSMSNDLIELISDDMGRRVKIMNEEEENSFTFYDDPKDLEPRAPVVTVMGHVDHGKTSLLDAIRHTAVTSGEAGGITQHIGASEAVINGRKITFVDTPGHEAFTAMRARGAKVTDIVILVVAADDGVMPQTVEAINHAKAAGVPIVVAVNKIDKEGADPQKIRGQLTEYGLTDEEWGGDTMFVDISAKQNENIESLLEAVLLTADAALDLRANPDMDAQGIAIEAHLDRGRGPVATVIVQRGTLRVGDSIVVGDAYGRVRRMVDEYGKDVTEAGPSRPVQVQGLTSVCGAGDNLLVVDEDRTARQIADRRDARRRNALQARNRRRVSLENLDEFMKETNSLNLILKGDNAGTVEALEEALLKIEMDDEVQLNIIDRGVGAVTQTNVTLAEASDAVIIGFNVRSEGKATEAANAAGVDIRYYTVIYKAIEEVEQALKGMLKPIYEEREIGRAEIRAIFKASAIGLIAGCMVESGKMRRNAKVRLIRDGNVIAEQATITSLRREKDDATEVSAGYECGMVLSYPDIQVDDIVEAYEMVEVPRT